MGACFRLGDDTAGRLRHADESVFDGAPRRGALDGTREWRAWADACRPDHAGADLLHGWTRGPESGRPVRDSFENAMERRSSDYDLEHERAPGGELRGPVGPFRVRRRPGINAGDPRKFLPGTALGRSVEVSKKVASMQTL